MLLRLYGFSIDEYRFEVRLNWDRMRDYLIINLGLLTVTTGLLRTDISHAGNLFVTLMFIVAAGTSFFGAKAVRQGHKYYKRTVYKKTLIEKELGLLNVGMDAANVDATLAIGTTPGMGRIDQILHTPANWIDAPIARDSIVFYTMTALRVLGLINVVGVAIGLFRLYRDPPAVVLYLLGR